MAVVNAAVREQLQKAGIEPLVINLAASTLDRSVVARLGRFPRVLWGLGRLVCKRGLRGQTLYMSVSDGLGQIYEILFALLARLRGMRVFLHHHSFAYLDIPSWLMGWLVRVAGADAIHIALSQKMADRLKAAYDVELVVPISNAVFFVAQNSTALTRRNLETLGFLSNITPEKGVFEFLDLCATVRDKGLSLRAQLAGPFQDDGTERVVRERLAAQPTVVYVGPKYGAEKDVFYMGIDALIFPTHNEAEPVVLHEAISRAIPVIAYGRGCIPEIIGPDCGLVIDIASSFVPAAVAQIETWLDDPEMLAAASKAAAQRFAKTYAENAERWAMLLTEISGGVLGG
jgi:glycosyltransferase involved in cell wall biosynthesis